jgi:protein arginine kinase activator
MGQPSVADLAGLTCPACGLKYAAFRADGRLGCPDDYDAFRPALEPLLDRIHRGTRHEGKTPRAANRRAELATLREQLAAAVAAEHYEDAARLRDRIRQKENLG